MEMKPTWSDQLPYGEPGRNIEDVSFRENQYTSLTLVQKLDYWSEISIGLPILTSNSVSDLISGSASEIT